MNEKKYDIHQIELFTPFQVGPVNTYLISDQNHHVLVDCGLNHPKTERMLMEGLASYELEPKDLSAVILTHGHVDHVGLANRFQAAGVPICAPPGVETWLQPGGAWDGYRESFYRAMYQRMGVPQSLIDQAISELYFLQQLNDRSVVDVTIPYGVDLEMLPGFTALHVPGHAQHALALWQPSTRELISGDQLIYHISSNAIVEPVLGAPSGREATRTKSLLQYRDNLRVLRQFGIFRTYPGHGKVFKDCDALIDKRLASQEQRKHKFKSLLERTGRASTFELAVQYFPKHTDQLQLIMSETLGYLDWLAEDGLVVERLNGRGEAYWQLTE